MRKDLGKRLLCLLLALPFILPAAGCGKKAPEPAEREYNEKGYLVLPFSHGLNVNVMCYPYFPVTSLYWKMLKGKTYKDIAAAGFDHLRLSVDFRYLYNEKKNTLNPYLMKRVDSMIDKAEKAGLYVCLLSSGWGQLDTDIPGEKDKFLAIWRLLAERYKDRSDYLSFELLNEPLPNWPGGNLDVDNVNVLQREVIGIIRESNPDRLILAAAAESNAAFRLKDMKLPRDDKNIALVVHIYDPGEFTHQGATWSDPNNTKQVRLMPWMIERSKQHIETCRDYMKKTGVPVIINEFGVNTKLADEGDITEYLASFTNCCREYGLAWTYFTYWEIGGGFGVWQKGKWVPAIMDGLFPEETEQNGE